MELYIPKSGNIFSICIKDGYHSISIAGIFRWSTVSGFWLRRPRIEPKMAALQRLDELVKLDQITGLECKKCIKYPLNFYYGIREGNELQYSGYERTIFNKILRRK